MQEVPHILGFTAGELTPWLSTRYDLQAYQRGAALISNFIVQPYGGVKRRHGTAFMAESGAGSEDAVRLFPFTYSETDALMLEFYPGRMRVYRDGKPLPKPKSEEDSEEGGNGGGSLVHNPDGSVSWVPNPVQPPSISGGAESEEAYEVEVPWRTAEQIRSLRVTQVNDAVYVTCPTHPPVLLSRLADTNWRCKEVEFDTFPRAVYTKQDEAMTVKRVPRSDTVILQLPEKGDAEFTPEMAGREYVLLDADVPEQTDFRNMSFAPIVSPFGSLKSSSFQRRCIYYTINTTTSLCCFWTCIRDYSPADYAGSTRPEDYPSHFMAGAVWWPDIYGITEVCGDWELRTNGVWNAQMELWRSYDHPDTARVLKNDSVDVPAGIYLSEMLDWDWTCVKSFGQSAYSERKNWALTGSEDLPCRMCVVVREADAVTMSPMLFFRKFRSSREYKFLITEVTSAHKAKAKALSCYSDFPQEMRSRKWSFGAFGEYNGYPAFSSYSGGRLWFGGMRRSPTTLVGSVVDDFHNFRVSSEDDSALHLTIASDNQSRICWIAPARGLLVGTSEGVWMLGSGDSGPLTPSNAVFRRQTSVGCENLPALAVEGCVIFPQRGGTRLREISYKLESDGFAASDLSVLAEHLLRSGVREYAVQEGQGSYVWVVLNDGSLAVLTLHPEQQVSAWQRVEIPGYKVLHVATLPRAGADLDEVWLVVRRGESGVLSVQRICPENVYLDDSSVEETTLVGCLVHQQRFAGQDVCLLQDGAPPRMAHVEENGYVYGVEPHAVYHIGYPYTSELHTLPLESMNSFNSVREMSRLRLRLLESSLNAEYKATHAERWEKLEADRQLLREPFSGSVRLSHMPEAAVGQGLCLRCTGAGDFRLLGLTVEVDHHGK